MASSSLDKYSIGQMLAEVKRRARARANLARLKAKLEKQLRAVESRLGRIGATSVKGILGHKPRRRARNTMTLPEAMGKVMSKQKSLSVPQIATAARKAGYKSMSKTFHTIIYQTLARDKRFKKAARGQYVLKAA